MKRFAIATLALALLGFLLTFDLSVTGQRVNRGNTSANRRTTNSGRGNNISRTNSRSTLSKEQTLYQEVEQLSNEYWRKIATKCGDTYYWIGGRYYEGKGVPNIYIEKYTYHPPRQLTPAEELNNVDPQPIEFAANSVIAFKVGRSFVRGNWQFVQTKQCDASVCRWQDNFEVKAQFVKSKGQWRINTTYFEENRPVPCGADGVPVRGRQELNMDSYCKRKHGSSAQAVVLDRLSAFSWRCKVPDGSNLEIDTSEACRMLYGDNFSAKYDNSSKPYSWYCIEP